MRYVDYGNEGTLSCKHVKELHTRMVQYLPAQAIPCILNGVGGTAFKTDDVYEVTFALYFLQYYCMTSPSPSRISFFLLCIICGSFMYVELVGVVGNIF